MGIEEIREISDRLYEDVIKYKELMKPIEVVLIKGTKEEYDSIAKSMVDKKTLIKLNEKEYPNCYLYRSDRNDVARSEENTYICTKMKDEAGPTNNWVEEREMYEKLASMLSGIMEGKVMYVVPYLLGPANSQFSSYGVELTDNPYVVISQMVIANVGKDAIEGIRKGNYVLGIQATGTLDPSKKYIAHFPEKKLIITVNSAYGGNALLSKKGQALRIESYLARNKELLVEHMMAIEVINPDGKTYGITGAFPSSSGKTNLAMIEPPKDYKGWDARLLSDDIAWIKLIDGKLMATNPEYGFFGVVPGTNEKTNANALEVMKHDTIFTNVALDTKNNTPWWEGKTEKMPDSIEDWQGNRHFEGYAAHPNSRFTSPISQYPKLSKAYGSKTGLEVNAILFGGRRSTLVPLVYQAYSMEHGILIGAMLRAESTAATTGKIGVIKNDPMAMRPFCGYNMADYFDHWRKVLLNAKNKPLFFNVNWFRKGRDGAFLWPGFGENMRVIKWITERIDGKAEAIETPIGYVPSKESFDKGSISDGALEELLEIDRKGWIEELDAVKPFFDAFGERMPKWLWDEYYKLRDRLISW